MLAATDSGSFTAAAAALGLTHGSISRRISGLEAWLGTNLFERHGRGVRLTPAGQRFAAEARRALSGLSRSAEQWRPWRGRQTVRMSTVPSFARLWLLPRLAQLERDDIHVELAMDHRPIDLDARGADVAIRYGAGHWDGIEARLLFRETLVPATAPQLAEALAADSSPEVMLRLPLLHDSDVSQWRAWLDAAGYRYRPRWQDRRFEDYDTVLAAAAAGLGIALLRRPYADQLVESGRLVAIAGRTQPNPSAHFLCTRRGEQRAAVVELGARLTALASA